jgi:cytochrome c biogenesis protein CcmG/thiol:disulfide interchange protein DsbE
VGEPLNRWVQLAFALLAVFLLSLTLYQRTSDCQNAPTNQGVDLLDPQPVDFPIPDLTLPGLDGRSVKLADQHDQPVLINFWATWCSPCIQELPQLLALAQKLHGRAQVWLISVDESFDEIRTLAAELTQAEINQPHIGLAQVGQMLQGKEPNVFILLDAGENAAKQFGTYKYPESFLLNTRGRVHVKFLGPKPWGHPRMIEYLSHEGFLSGS